MNETIIYVDRVDVKKVEQEERESFVRNIIKSFQF